LGPMVVSVTKWRSMMKIKFCTFCDSFCRRFDQGDVVEKFVAEVRSKKQELVRSTLALENLRTNLARTWHNIHRTTDLVAGSLVYRGEQKT
jgi:hypothetical protein